MSPANSLILIAALCLLQPLVQGFTTTTTISSPLSRTVSTLHSTRGDDDFPREEKEEYTGDVDWDAEWKKVMEAERSGKKVVERPGKDFYKSDAEIAAIRAANKAKAEVQKISSNIPSAPSMNMQSLTGDWKVCHLFGRVLSCVLRCVIHVQISHDCFP